MLPLEQLPSIENNDDTQSIDYNSDEWKKVNILSFIQNNREQTVTVQVNRAYWDNLAYNLILLLLLVICVFARCGCLFVDFDRQ